MNEFQVTFLDRPIVGGTVRIIYNGQVGQTARIASVQQHPNQPNYFRVVTEQSVVCIGVFNPSAQATAPAQTQVMHAPPPNTTQNANPKKMAILPVWIWAIIGIFCFFLLLGCLLPNSETPYDYADHITISDIRLVDGVTPSDGTPCQWLEFSITNNNNVSIIWITGDYDLQLDGSGLGYPQGTHHIANNGFYSGKIAPHETVQVNHYKHAFILPTRVYGHCAEAHVRVTKAYDEVQNEQLERQQEN